MHRPKKSGHRTYVLSSNLKSEESTYRVTKEFHLPITLLKYDMKNAFKTLQTIQIMASFYMPFTYLRVCLVDMFSSNQHMNCRTSVPPPWAGDLSGRMKSNCPVGSHWTAASEMTAVETHFLEKKKCRWLSNWAINIFLRNISDYTFFCASIFF